MKNYYTNFFQRFNKIYYRGFENGKRISKEFNYEPTLYLPGESTPSIKSLYGKELQKKRFDSISEAKDFVKNYSDVYDIHGSTYHEYSYISETFTGVMDIMASDLTITFIDIETSTELGGFPSVDDALEEVLLITVVDGNTKEMVTWGARPTDNPDVKNYVLCKSEKEVLTSFIHYVVEKDTDIFSGWYLKFFDIPYLCNRIEKVLGRKFLEKLSPFGIVDKKVMKITNNTFFEIAGRAVLDLQDLYKKFRFKPQESYKLDHIAFVELGKRKIDQEAETFRDRYLTDSAWGIFIQYNQVDTQLVDELEDELGLVYLAITLAYLCKVNFTDVFSPVRTWESYIGSILYERSIFCPMNGAEDADEEDRSIDGGYVKEPLPGFHKWIICTDGTSLYPSFIMSCNMSPETIVGKLDSSVEKLLAGINVNNTPHVMAANGALFTREKQGILPELTAGVFSDRKAAKKKMIALEQKYEETKDDAYLKESKKYGVLQLALKVFLNSLFGASANKYFMFFDNRIAEGITQSGQYCIKRVEIEINNDLNKIFKTKNKDYVIAIDTDSNYFTVAPIVEADAYKDFSVQKKTDIANKFFEKYMQPTIDRAVEDVNKNLSFFENRINFKRESISDSGFWTGKKRYCLRVIDNEGVRYAEPEIKIVGIEVVRSSTPQIAKDWLRESINYILDYNRDDLISYVDEKHGEFKKQAVEAIAFPRSANNLDNYIDYQTIYKKGCPIAVRASLLYNHHLEKKNVRELYEEVKEGSKIKFVYLRQPNMIRENVIGFSSKLPPEFGLHEYIDYETQWQKVFLGPLENITNAVGWKLQEEASLEDFFS